tara:strand:- start:2779 stop:3840 length:1062 start_codon:yes stop_codon:yes gene_type:complete
MGIKLNEAVGVPKGIVVAGEKLYDDFKRKVIPMLKDGQTEYKVNFKPNEPYTIGDEEINNVEIDLTLRPDSDKYGEANMQVYRKNTIGKIGSDYVLMKVNKNGTVILSIDKPVPEDWTIDEVIQSINKGKVQTVSALSHELKHEYDDLKTPHTNVKKVSEYQSNTEMFDFPIGAIQRMFYDLYYLDGIENSVRPTELYAKLKTLGIGKSGFLDYLRKEYFIVMESMKFSVDEMVREIYTKMDSVDDLLSQVDIGTDIKNLSDDEKVNLVLRVAYISASNTRRQNYGDSLVDDELEAEVGFVGDKAKQFDKYEKSFDKYEDDIMKFYKDIEKYLKTTASKVLKKLGKVYSLLPD